MARRGRPPGSGVEVLKTCLRIRFVHQGKVQRQTLWWKPTAANIRAAERLVARIRHDVDFDIFSYERYFPGSIEASQRRFPVYARAWLDGLIAEKGTRSDYEAMVEDLWIPAFGDRAINDIKPSEIRRIIAKRSMEVSAKTVNNNLIPLRGIFQAAVDDGLLEHSPLRNIRNRRHQAPLPDPFTPDEMEEILDHLREHAPEQVWNWYMFAFGTGVRPSEQIALQWGDIDWNHRTIRVRRARVRGEVKGTKTAVERDVDLSDGMIAVLERQKRFSERNGPDTPIFLNPVSGRPWPDVQDQRKLYFHPALETLGIRRRDAKQTRHTFATVALMGGVNSAYISRQLGHVDPRTVFRSYARWIDGADHRREAIKLNRLFSGTGLSA